MPKQAIAHSIMPALPRALPKAHRQKVEQAIEAHLDAISALTGFLDEIDGESDLEDGADGEPSLGSREGTARSCEGNQGDWGHGPSDDLEDEHDGREWSLGTGEPALWAMDQTEWHAGAHNEDLEDDGADFEPDSDDEEAAQPPRLDRPPVDSPR